MDYHARYYDATLGRFISPDSVVPDFGNPQALNRYAYVRGNPVRFDDPSGHCPTCIAGAIIGAVAGTVLYSWNISRSGQRFQWKQALEVGATGAVAGALIGSGVGAGAGASMAAAVVASAGVGIAAGGGGYLAANAINKTNFDTTEFAISSGVGAVQGAIGQGMALGTAGSAVLGGTANLVQYELTKFADNEDTNLDAGAGRAFAIGMITGGISGGYIKPKIEYGVVMKNWKWVNVGVERFPVTETLEHAIKHQLPTNFARSYSASTLVSTTSQKWLRIANDY